MRRWVWAPWDSDILLDFLPADLNRDGQSEIVIASYNRRLYVVGAAGETYWEVDTGGSVFGLAVADLTGDGIAEVLSGSENGMLLAFSAEGALLWQQPLGGRVTAIATADLDDDGRPEVLAGVRPGRAWAFLPDGTPLWQAETAGAPTAFVQRGGMHNRSILLSTESGVVQALDTAGVLLWARGGAGYLRGLTPLEGGVLAGGQEGLLGHLSAEGEVRLELALSGPVATTAVLDLGKDGQPDLLAGVAGEEAGLLVLDPAGRTRWFAPLERGVWAIAHPDLEGDGEPEIVVGTDGGEIVLLDAYGRVRGRTWVPFRVHGLLALDLDGDGRDELLARASHHLYAFAGDPQGSEGERQPVVATLERWPAEVALPQPQEGQITLAAVGDVMIGRAVESRMLVYGASFPFEPFRPLLEQADITTGNLECVLADGGTPLRKTYTFRGHPGLVSGLSEAGFDLLTLANNHARDLGWEGLTETVAVLRGAGIAAVGAGKEPYAPVFLEVQGLRLAFLGRTVAIAPQEGVAWGEAAELRQAVAQARQQADLVIVHLHGGIEYSPTADATQRQLAQAAAEGGAALVIGHHPHAPQEVEWIGSTLVAYSLGDFVFDIDDHDIARDAALLWVVLSREGVEKAVWVPGRIVDDVQPRPLDDGSGRPVMREVRP